MSWRLAGAALLALLPLHAWLRPEGGWALLSTCDLAAVATGVGLVASNHVLVGTAFLFQLMVGLPALAIGILTTYQWNITGIAIHVVPLALGAIRVRREGLPRRAALHAWLAYAVSIALSSLTAPAIYNINFASRVWPPLAGTLSLPLFLAALLAVVGMLLALGELSWRRVRAR